MNKLFTSALAVVALGLLPSVASAQEEMNEPESVSELLKTLKEQRDNADVGLVKKLSNKKTRDAMEGLLELYDVMQSVYMRRAVCQGLALYDKVNGAEQPALQKLMDVSVGASERELREAGIELLGGCNNYGRAFLKMIVESSADDDIRERGMELHVARARDEDVEWYREIFDPTAGEKARKASKKARGEEKLVPHLLPALRVLAFDALRGDMDASDLVDAASDSNQHVRAIALEELDSRGDKDAVLVAEDIYDKGTEPVPTRLVAARILLNNRGAKIADDLIKDATKKEVSGELSSGIAEMLVKMNDESVNKKLLKKAGKGKGAEKLFYLRATRHLDDPKLAKAVIKLLKDKDPQVQLLACELIGERRDKEALKDLEKLIDKSKDPLVITAALGAVTELRRNDQEWNQQLIAYATHDEQTIRNSALEALGRTMNPDYVSMLVEALDHDLWSTRLAAARALETMRLEEGVGALCGRISKETGRMAFELADILFRLTGQSFRTNGRMWTEWWAQEGAGFKIISESKLRQFEDEEEARRLKQISRTEFFGIRINSHRVVFILDVSGSMNEPTRGKYLGESGPARIDVAKKELLKVLAGLDLNSLFNVVTFSSDVDAWQDRISENTETTLEEAKSYVKRLGAGGGTNLFGSLEFAFADPDVDTIFVLSDGEPTAGDLTDGAAIRGTIGAWNEHRGVVINCIAVGGSLQILEWLAEDTGGTYLKYP